LSNQDKIIIDFTLIYNKNKTKIFNYILKMVNNRMIAEDIVQNTFLKFYENLDNIRNKESIVYWLYRTARNDIYSYYRGKKIKVDQFNQSDIEEIDKEDDNDLQDQIELNEIKDIVRQELDKMQVYYREVFVLKEYSQLSYKEISDVLGIDENLVKSRLFNCRQNLINKIKKII